MSKEIQKILDEQRRLRKEMGSILDNEAKVNYSIASQLKAEDPEYRAKMKLIHESDEFREKQGKLSREYWDTADREEIKKSRKENYTDARRQQVREQFKDKPKTERQRKAMSEAQKEWYKSAENKKIHAARMKKAASKISEANSGKPKTKKTVCVHCGVEFPNHTIKRHQNNCEKNPNRQVNPKKK
jgi:hypothetical protein